MPYADRWLILHPESDSLFEIHDHRVLRQCLRDGCQDVTGIEDWEHMFKRYGKFYIKPRRKLIHE